MHFRKKLILSYFAFLNTCTCYMIRFFKNMIIKLDDDRIVKENPHQMEQKKKDRKQTTK